MSRIDSDEDKQVLMILNSDVGLEENNSKKREMIPVRVYYVMLKINQGINDPPTGMSSL